MLPLVLLTLLSVARSETSLYFGRLQTITLPTSNLPTRNSSATLAGTSDSGQLQLLVPENAGLMLYTSNSSLKDYTSTTVVANYSAVSAFDWPLLVTALNGTIEARSAHDSWVLESDIRLTIAAEIVALDVHHGENDEESIVVALASTGDAYIIAENGTNSEVTSILSINGTATLANTTIISVSVTSTQVMAGDSNGRVLVLSRNSDLQWTLEQILVMLDSPVTYLGSSDLIIAAGNSSHVSFLHRGATAGAWDDAGANVFGFDGGVAQVTVCRNTNSTLVAVIEDQTEIKQYLHIIEVTGNASLCDAEQIQKIPMTLTVGEKPSAMFNLPHVIINYYDRVEVFGNTTCGDGRLEVVIMYGALAKRFEECDDGNNISGDGCSARCAIETGWSCSGDPTQCSPSCAPFDFVLNISACENGTVTLEDATLTEICPCNYTIYNSTDSLNGVTIAADGEIQLELNAGKYTIVFTSQKCSSNASFNITEDGCSKDDGNSGNNEHWIKTYVPIIVILGTVGIGLIAAATVMIVVRVNRRHSPLQDEMMFDLDEHSQPQHNFFAKTEYN